MAFVLDTNVAIHQRDGNAAVTDRVAALDGAVLIPVITRVELDGGVYREPAWSAIRRARLAVMLAALPTLDFDAAAADAYGAILAHAGYSRGRLLDRMIAAQAPVHRATRVTGNADDPTELVRVGALRFHVVRKEVPLRDRIVGFLHWRQPAYRQQAIGGVRRAEFDDGWLRAALRREGDDAANQALRAMAAADDHPVDVDALERLLEELRRPSDRRAP